MDGEVAKCSTPVKGHGNSLGFAMSCSVCLEAVVEDAGDRSIAKLKCGHHFHLDCIGSAFNAKGRMQCPNCRQVEHGQWLFASGFYLQHEDFVDDFAFEEEIEAFGGATNSQFSPAPWCPHQGPFAQFSLTFAELDSNADAYVDPVVNRSRASTLSRQVCPYLATQGLSVGGPSREFIGLPVGYHRLNHTARRAASFHRSFGHQQALATSSSMPTSSYDGSYQSYTPVGGLLQPNGNQQRALGFLVGSPQSVDTGGNQGTSRASRTITTQLSHIPNTHTVNTVSHLHSVNASRSGGTRHHEVSFTPQRTSQGPSTAMAWATELVHEFIPLLASGLGQVSNPVVGDVGWAPATESQLDPWINGIFVPQPSMELSSQWWAWVPSGSTHGHQRLAAGGAPTNSYQNVGTFLARH